MGAEAGTVDECGAGAPARQCRQHQESKRDANRIPSGGRSPPLGPRHPMSPTIQPRGGERMQPTTQVVGCEKKAAPSSEGAKETQLACRDISSEDHSRLCHPEEPFSWRRRICAIWSTAELLPTSPPRTINGASSCRHLRASTGSSIRHSLTAGVVTKSFPQAPSVSL